MSNPTHPITGEPIRLHNPANPEGAPNKHAALVRLGLADGEPSGVERRQTSRPAPFVADTGITSTGRYTDRHTEHEVGTPPRIAALWDRVLELASQVRKAYGQARPDLIESDKRIESRKAAEAALQALEAGEEPEPATPTDWAAVTLTREARWRALSAQLRKARREYDEAVEDGLLEWRDSLTAGMGELQEKALAQATATAATVSELSRLRSAAEALERVRDAERVFRNTEYKTQEAQTVLSGGADMSHVLAYLRSTDPVVTREWISAPDSSIVPPVHIRRAMAQDWNTAQHLAHIEAREGYQLTRFTEREWKGRVPAADNSPAPSLGYHAV